MQKGLSRLFATEKSYEQATSKLAGETPGKAAGLDDTISAGLGKH